MMGSRVSAWAGAVLVLLSGPVRTAASASRGAVILTASYLQQFSQSLEILGVGVEAIEASRWPFVGGSNSSATIRLYSPATAGGTVVPLRSDRSDLVALPPQVTVPAGQSWVQVDFTTRPVARTTPITLTAG